MKHENQLPPSSLLPLFLFHFSSPNPIPPLPSPPPNPSLYLVPRSFQELYTKAVKLQNAVPHPRTLGIIQECGGKMYMAERQYELAKDAFMLSFKGFDEAGDTSRLRVLRYLLLASMLQVRIGRLFTKRVSSSGALSRLFVCLFACLRVCVFAI